MERDTEFDRLNATDDIAQREEAYYQAVQNMAVERVRLQKARARDVCQGDLDREVECLTK